MEKRGDSLYLSYEKGKKRIFLILLYLSTFATIMDLIILNDSYTFLLKVLSYTSIAIYLALLIVYYGKILTNERTLIIIANWNVTIILALSHLLYTDSTFPNNELQMVFTRDAIFLVCIISITGLLGDVKHAYGQATVLLSILFYYSFINIQSFILENFALYLIVVIGFTGLIAFFVYYIDEFLKNLNNQKNALELKNRDIISSIHYAKRIQEAILPPQKLVKKYLKDSFVLYKPKDIVAGDFYWVENKDDLIYFAAADCTGHGVPGAMVSVVCSNGLNRSIHEYNIKDPGELLNKTRELVIHEFEKSIVNVYDGMDIALCTLQGNQLSYAGANNPLWIIRDGEIIIYKADHQPIGRFAFQHPYTTHKIKVQKDDLIYLFTDGLVDQFGGENDKKFKPKQFKELLLAIHTKPIEEQKKLIYQAFNKWRGENEQVDDICIIGIRI
jgi:serine phosphatase RsbU (regulator of sigma subunit)